MGEAKVVMVWTVGDAIGAAVCSVIAGLALMYAAIVLAEETRRWWRRRQGGR